MTAASHSTNPGVATLRLRVLLADDTPEIRELLRRALEAQDMVIVGEAADGAEAVEQAAATRPDVILLDLSMPHVDGLEAIPGIRRVSPRTRIVALSGFTSSAIVEEALERGAHAYVPKGTTAAAIAAKIREVCGSHVPAPPPTAARTEHEDGSGTLSALVHELRNQATVVDGFSEMLLQSWDALSDGQRRGYLERVASNAAQMRSLLEVLTDVDQIGSRRLRLAPQPLALSAVARETVDDMAVSTKRAIDLVVEADPVVRADPLRLRQVLTNLLSNAAKFSPANTAIVVTVRAVVGGGELCVDDEGPGIPPGRRDELFKPFHRLDASQPGTGLGLYISREIVHAHGGALLLGDRERGCRFVVRLPGARG